MTYSAFEYASFGAQWNSSADTQQLPPDSDIAPIPQGGRDSLYDIIASATVEVTNAGNATAAEVAQLYVDIPESGVARALRGFDKLLLTPGLSGTATFDLRRRDLSVWDVNLQQWVLNRGTYTLMVGKSVLDIVANTTLEL